jgi:hypothetical protein
MDPGAAWRLQGLGSRSVELQVVLAILLVVSCFSIYAFRAGSASWQLWDPVGAFWGPLMFLFQGS